MAEREQIDHGFTVTAGDIISSGGKLQAGTTVTAGTSITAGTTVTAGTHLLATGTAPTAAAGANNGTTPPAPVITAGDNDVRGNITFGSGGSAAGGEQVDVTFAKAYGAAPIVMVNPDNDATQQLGIYVSASSTTGFSLSCHGAPTSSQANTVYSFDYMVIG